MLQLAIRSPRPAVGRRRAQSWACRVPALLALVLSTSLYAQLPVADFDWTPENPPTGVSVEFRDRSTGATSSNFIFGMHGGGQPRPGPTITMSFVSVGTFEMRLVATNASGSSTMLRRINVGVPAAASFTASALTVSTGQPVEFTDTSSGIVRTWSWSFGDNTTSTAQNPTHAWTTPGTYEVALDASYSSGTLRTTRTITVQGAGELKSDFTWDPLIPGSTTSIQFLDQSTGDPTSWSWNFGDGETSTMRSPRHEYPQPGLYPVVLIVGKGTKTDVAAKQIKVGTTTDTKAAFTWSPGNPTAREDVQFLDRSTGAPIKWRWSFGDGTSGSVPSPIHRYAVPGSYQATLEVTDSFGTLHSSSRTIHVAAKPGPTAAFYAPCCGFALREMFFSNQSSASSKTFKWNFGDGTTSSERNPSHRFLIPGTYRVELTAKNDDGESSTSRTIRIDPAQAPTADFAISVGTHSVQGLLALPAGNLVRFTNLSSENAVRFEWTVERSGTRVQQATTRNFSMRFEEPGDFLVTLRAIAADDATGTISRNVRILPKKPVAADFICEEFSAQNAIPNVNNLPAGTCVMLYRCFHQSTGFTDLKWDVKGSLGFGYVGVSPDFRSPIQVNGGGTVTLTALRTNADGTIENSVKTEVLPFRMAGLIPVENASFERCPLDSGGLTNVVAGFTWAPQRPRAGQDVRFKRTDSNASITRWNIDGQSYLGAEVLHRFTTAGPKRVSLEVVNAASSDRLTKTVDVVSGDGPIFQKVESRYGDCYYSGFLLDVLVDAKMSWKDGFNGARASYSINGGSSRPATIGSTGDLEIAFESTDLRQGSGATRNDVRIVAEGRDGVTSNYTLPLYSIEASPWMSGGRTQPESRRLTVVNTLKVPNPPLNLEITSPAIGSWKENKFGLKDTQGRLQQVFRTDCTSESEVRGETGFHFAGFQFLGEIHGKVQTEVSKETGISTSKGVIGFELAGGGTVGPTALVKWVPQAAPFCEFRWIGKICDRATVKEEVAMRAGVDWNFKLAPDGTATFDETTGIFGPEGRLSLKLEASDNIDLELWGGGRFQMKFGYPTSPFVRGAEMKFGGGVKLHYYLFEYERQLTTVCNFTTAAWNCTGAALDAAKAMRADGALPLSPMPVAVQRERRSSERRARGEAVVASSLSRVAAPSAVAAGDTVVVAYVSENPAAGNPLQRTDVRFMTLRDGVWSSPQALTSDDLAEFAPALAATSNGGVVALWQRVRNAALRNEDVQTTADLPKINKEIEIVASAWSRDSGTWSSPIALTDNAVFDHDAVPVALSDGRVVALWLRDASNEASGTPASPTQLMVRIWNGSAWGPESVVAEGLFGVQALHASSRGTAVTAVWSRQKDANAVTAGDREIAYVTFDGTSWSAARDLTSDSIDDLFPRVAYGSAGARILWLRGTDLVWQALDGNRETVRTSESGGTLANAAVTVAPGGNFVVVWSGSLGGTTDVLARTYDSGARTWSEDIPLTRNEAMESALSSFFGSDGRLQVIGLETAATYVDQTRTVDGKETVIPNVPQPGAISLLHLEKEIIVDLSVVPFTIASSAEAPAAGATVRLTAELRNSGDLPVRDVPLIVYAGRGTAGEVVASDKVSGDWNAGTTRKVEISFSYSDKTREVTLAVDPAGQSGDTRTTDNTAIFSWLNAPPVACVQMSRMMGAAPLAVTFDAGCSTDRDGRISSIRWTFADGAGAIGTTASHTFETSGVHPVTAIVTDDLGRSSTTTVQVFVNAIGDPRTGIPAAEPVFVPVVGRTAGAAGTFFVSDAAIFNGDSVADLVVEASYFPDGRNDFYSATLTVPPNQIANLVDMLGQTFHASGIGWARFDLSHPHARITSRSYNRQPGGTAGTFVPGQRADEAIVPGSKLVFLQEWRDGYRVNLGLTEVSGDGGTVTATSYDEGGALIGTKTYALGPWQHVQIGGESIYQRRGRLELTVDGGAVLGYISTIDNRSGDAVYQTGTEATSIPAAPRWLVPIVGRLRGGLGTNWRSDIRLFNTSTSPTTARVTLVLADRTIDKNVPLSGGQTAAFDDVITALFPEVVGDAGGALTVSADVPVVVTARTYNQTDKGTYGVATAARLTDRLLAQGDRVDLIQLQNDADYRCNFGVTGGSTGARVAVRGFDARGAFLGEKEYEVGSGRNTQWSGVFAQLGVTDPLPAARLEVTILEGSAYVYATVVDNRTGDGIFVEGNR